MHRLFALAGFAFTFSLIGCGGADVPDVGEVSGTVTIDGKPAPNIIVSFMPTEGGRTSTGVTDAEGRYELQYSPDSMGALIGTHNATISASGPSADADAATGRGMLVDTSIPKDYQGMKKQVEVKAGDNTVDLKYP